MSKAIGVIIGAYEIAAGIALEIIAPGNPAGIYLISAGIGTVIAGIGTLLQKGLQAPGATSRNPVAPWQIVYGRARVGGSLIYVSEWDDNNKYLDMVIVLAAHVCKSVDALLFDGQRIPLDANGCSVQPPADQTGPNILSIVRSNGVVTVQIASPITDPAGGPLQTGDQIIIKNVTGDKTFNGQYAVTVVDATHFTYICGGVADIGTGGQTQTTWPNYKAKVHMEILLGNHTATFPGMITGTPYDGDPGNLVIRPNNPWTAAHQVLGKCCVFLRLHYNDQIFANGLPATSFRLSGKADILDPRVSPGALAYTENPALIIADYLSNKTFGYKATYGTEIPTAQLIAAANTCDTAIALAAGGTEPLYACNGSFPLTMKRGDVLQNLLTSCGGRITYTGGQFVIQPASCVTPSLVLPPKTITSATLYVISTHIQGVGYHGSAGFSVGPVGLGFGQWLLDQSAWTNRLDSVALGPSDITALQNGTENANFDIEGALFGDASPPDELIISDCWITAIYSDGSVQTLRPLSFTTFQGSAGIGSAVAQVTPTASTATVTRNHFSALGLPPVAGFGSFFGPVLSGSPPDQSASGMTGSGLALARAAGPFRWRQKLPIRDLYNGVKGTYISPANNWLSSDIPPYAQDTLHGYASGSPLYPFGDANLFADGGDRRWKDIQLPFTISVSMAQRLCKIELLRIRHQGTGTFAFNMAMYQTTVLDVILMTLPVLGWTNKMLEITAHRFTINKQNSGGTEVTLLGTEIDVQEYDCTTFAWSTSEELTAHGFQQSTLPTNFNILGGITPSVNDQTGQATYQFALSDRANLVTLSNPAGVAATLPEAGQLSGQADGLWYVQVQNTGTGNVVITPANSPTNQSIDGQSSLTLQPGQGVEIFSNGANGFTTQRGMALAPAGYVIDPIVNNTVSPDLSLGLTHEIDLVNSTQITINNVVYGSGNPVAGLNFTIVIVQGPAGGLPSPLWGPGYKGVTGFEIGPDANARTTFRFVVTPDGNFHRNSVPDVNVPS